MNRYFRLKFPANNHIPSKHLAALPIPHASPKKEENRIATLVDQMLQATERRYGTHAEHERLSLEGQCAALDAQIERLVSALFGVQPQEAN